MTIGGYETVQVDSDDSDNESNTGLISNDPRSAKGKDESISMSTLSRDHSVSSSINDKGSSNNKLQNEDNQMSNESDNEGSVTTNEENQTPSLKEFHNSEIHRFAIEGNDKCLEILKSSNVDINVSDEYRMTVLHYAAKNDHENLLKEFLKRGANRYNKDFDDNLPVHYAARQGSLNCVKALVNGCLREDPQLNDKTKNEERTALMEAVGSGNHDCCKELVGLDIDDFDKEGNTALHLAAKVNNEMIVTFLLDSGANSTQENTRGMTPLHEAARQVSRNCLALLFDNAQPDVFQVTKEGKNIIHFAVNKKSTDCLNYLLENKLVRANIDKCNESGKGTPLIYAMNCRAFDCINALLEAGASPTVDCNGIYPIHKAAELGFDSICEKILAKDNSLINQRNGQNQTPLHMAASKISNKTTVDLLFNKIREARINPSCHDNSGQTALHIAVFKADEKVVERLIKGDISTEKRDLNGLTALHLAAQLGKKMCCELLVKRHHNNLRRYCKIGHFPLDSALQNMEKCEETVLYLLRETSLEFGVNSKKKEKSDYSDRQKKLKYRMRKYMEEALDKGLRDIASALLDSDFSEDSLFAGKELKPENFKKLITAYPDLALKVQGKCIEEKTGEKTVYRFTHYEDTYYMNGEDEAPFDETTGKVKAAALEHHNDVYSWTENHSVNLMISEKKCELLKHPVTQAWLRHKWLSYIRYIHYSLLVFEGIYLSTLICFMATTWNWIHISNEFNVTKDEFCEAASQLYQEAEVPAESTLPNVNVTEVIKEFEKRVDPYLFSYYTLLISWLLKFIKEFFYMERLRHQYRAKEMLLRDLVEISQLILTSLLIFYPFRMCYQERLGLLQEVVVWQCGVFAVLFAWMHLINSINQALVSVFLPITQDFLEILKKVAYFIIAFISIFAFIFHLLLLEQNAFANFGQSIGSTLVWLLLDLGYTDTFIENKLSYPYLSNFIFFFFITTIGFLIVNLLSKEETVKTKGKELDPEYRRLVIYAQLILRYDICFPWFRRRNAVNKYVDSSTEKEESAELVNNDNREMVDHIQSLKFVISGLSDQVTSIKRQLSKMDDKLSALSDVRSDAT